MSTEETSTEHNFLHSSPNSKSQPFDHSVLGMNPPSSFTEASPGQAKRVLEAHIVDTDRRIQDASRLGTTLLEQKKQLAERLRDVELYQDATEVGPDLKQKLADLEKEYNEVGRDSARNLLPKSRQASSDVGDAASYSADGRSSPSKLQVPSRKSRNQPASRVHDIEFATEISSSLLGQVRYLNSVLAEKEEALKRAKQENAKFQADAEATEQRLRSLDDNEQRFKDENWHLETQVQDLTAQIKDAVFREQRLSQNLSTAKLEKSVADREYEELKQSHTQLNDDHSILKRQYDSDIAGLRRSVTIAGSERERLSKKIEDLNSQNEDLARAIAHRARAENLEEAQNDAKNDDSLSAEQTTPDPSPPPSPNKATPRHGGLESETLKSSLHHAHRMIQNLKNNIHREKTEKIELRRMLQDARDELETSRSFPAATANSGKRRKPEEKQSLFKKPSLHRLGAAKTTKEEIIDDPSWEEYDGSPHRLSGRATSRVPIATSTDTGSDAFETAAEQDTSDAGFETANERETSDAGFETADEDRKSTTGTEGFQTGAESLAGDSSDELTETEASHPSRSKGTPIARPKTYHRASYLSSASDDLDTYDIATPPRSASQRYQFMPNKALYRTSESTSTQNSPASFISNSSQPGNRQSLAAELEDFGDDNSSISQSTPSRTITSLRSSPMSQRKSNSPAHALFGAEKRTMIDVGTLTEPWTPNLNTMSPDGTGNAVGVSIATDLTTLEPRVPTANILTKPVSVGTLTEPWQPEERLVITTTADHGVNASTSTEPWKPEQKLVAITTSDHGIHAGTLTEPWEAREKLLNTTTADHGVNAGTLTESWEPASKVSNNAVVTNAIGGAVGGGLLSKLVSMVRSQDDQERNLEDTGESAEHAALINTDGPVGKDAESENKFSVTSLPLQMSTIMSQEVEPVQQPPNPKPQTTIFVPQPDFPVINPSTIVRNAPTWTEETNQAPSVASVVSRRPSMASLAERNRKSLGTANDTSADFAGLSTSGMMDEMSDQKPSFSAPGNDTKNDPFGPVVRDERSVLQPISGNAGTRKVAENEQNRTMLPDPGHNFADEQNSTPGSLGVDDMASPKVNESNLALPSAIRAASTAALMEQLNALSPKRPGSAGSLRKGLTASLPPTTTVPPLPADHRQLIAAASRNSSTVGLNAQLPHSPARGQNQLRPVTPNVANQQPESIGHISTPRYRTSSIAGRSEVTRRSSISSFASEVDQRINGRERGEGFVMSNLDPRMIQAITQTMIGEFLWKYTRKPGRGQISENRHKRFFWIHPYTRTLYWSGHDPSRAGKKELKAKSVSIQAVRVVADDNPIPPGLHQKSLIIVTPGRTIKFTAPTSGRHETWFNALSYLLLRTGQQRDDTLEDQIHNYSNQERPGTMGSQMSDYIPTLHNRPASRLTSGSRHSLSTIGTNRPPSSSNAGSVTNRPTSKHGRTSHMSSMGSRVSGHGPSRRAIEVPNSRISRIVEVANSGQVSPTRELGDVSFPEDPAERAENLEADVAEIDADGFKKPARPRAISRQDSRSGRTSSLSSRLRPASLFAGRKGHQTQDSEGNWSGSGKARESVEGSTSGSIHGMDAGDTAALENVRACCDGKHDVGSLSHRTNHRLSIGSKH